jgi:hypothetical protein
MYETPVVEEELESKTMALTRQLEAAYNLCQ